MALCIPNVLAGDALASLRSDVAAAETSVVPATVSHDDDDAPPLRRRRSAQRMTDSARTTGVTGTPALLVNRVAEDIAKVTAGSTLRDRVLGLGMEAVGNGPDEFNKYIRSEITRWGRIIRERKITAN